MITLYTIHCHCGETKQTKNRDQKSCSKRCANLTPGARARNRASGRKGAAASGITRRKYVNSTDYYAGYQAGWQAGRKAGVRAVLGEDVLPSARVSPGRSWELDTDGE